MKNILVIFCAVLSTSLVSGQIFSKEKLANLESFDNKFLTWGYFLGFNSYDFKFDYKEPTQDVIVEKTLGFNVGLVGDMRVNRYINLRLEPGLYFTTRNLTYPLIADEVDQFREVKSTYIHLPLLIKFSTKRLNNFKPFIVGGISTSLNLSSNHDNPDDNSAGKFRMTKNTFYYEVGFGIDLYLYYFKFTPSIRGIFAISDELIRDVDPNSPYTGNIAKMASRGIFINLTFQ